MTTSEGNQEPLMLKSGFTVYPIDITRIEKIGGAWTIWLRGTHVPLIITKPGDKKAYAQLERLMDPTQDNNEEEVKNDGLD